MPVNPDFREDHPREREAEHGQGDDEEGVVVQELRRYDPVDEDLGEQGDEGGHEGKGGRAVLPSHHPVAPISRVRWDRILPSVETPDQLADRRSGPSGARGEC